MLKKLRIKFICFTMALVVLMLGIIFSTVYGLTAQNLRLDSENILQSLSDKPIHALEGTPDARLPYLVLQRTAQGEWIARGNGYYDLTDQAYLSQLLNAAMGQQKSNGLLSEYQLRYRHQSIPFEKYTFLDVSAEQATLDHLIRICILIGGISLLLFFGISLLLANLALRPVEAAWEQQKQFVSDASHELKTPLAVIYTNAELLNAQGYAPEERQQFGKNILTMSQQMRHLVESLLDLTRLDNVAPDLAPVALSALAENTLLPFEPMFYEASLQLQSAITPGLWVKGDPLRLRQLMEIFLDNALKYAQPGPVQVSVQRVGNHALLWVQTCGKPLTPEVCQKIFRRFYREDPVRSTSGSYGLGLSIAQKIVHHHNGRVWAEPTDNGNRFCVLLPLEHRQPSTPASE